MARARNKDVALAENKLVLKWYVWLKWNSKGLENAICHTFLNYWPNFNQPRQQEVCTMFEGLSKTAQAELEMQKGRRVTHFQKSLHELAELEVCLWQLACQLSSSSSTINLNFSIFQVKHAKAHAQMLRQTISAIKTEVWDPSLGPADSSVLSFGFSRLLDLEGSAFPILQVIRSSAIWSLGVFEEL